MSTWLSRARKALLRQRQVAQQERARQEHEDARRAAYERHLHSDYWRQLRRRALARAQQRCEWMTRTGNRCTCTRELQVHHLHYDTFGHERLADVQVLCVRHHEIADRRRKQEMQQRVRRAIREQSQRWRRR